MRARTQPTDCTAMVIAAVRKVRQERGWTVQHLADLMTAQGCPTDRSVLAKLETRKRGHLTVDELYALAGAFGLPVRLLMPDGPPCRSCADCPPPGFRCLACGEQTDREDAS